MPIRAKKNYTASAISMKLRNPRSSVQITLVLNAFRITRDRDFSGSIGSNVSVQIAIVDRDPYTGVDAEIIPLLRTVSLSVARVAASLVTDDLRSFYGDDSIELTFQPSGVIILSQVVRGTGLEGFDRAIDLAAIEIGNAYIDAYGQVANLLMFVLLLRDPASPYVNIN